MKAVFSIVLKKIKLVVGEVLNLLTNLLVPLVDVLITLVALLPFVPKQVLAFLHKIEKFLEEAGTTLEDIEKEIHKF
jgi:fructose-specific phosphotransferase system IIC component